MACPGRLGMRRHLKMKHQHCPDLHILFVHTQVDLLLEAVGFEGFGDT